VPSEKSFRVSLKKSEHNRSIRTRARSAVTTARDAISGGDTAQAETAVVKATAVLDSAASRGIIHRNNASRRKSRLAKQLHGMTQPSE
jgi:small subunit ribosomal protein S20